MDCIACMGSGVVNSDSTNAVCLVCQGSRVGNDIIFWDSGTETRWNMTGGTYFDISNADLNLIEAAPDLYEALKAVEYGDRNSQWNRSCSECHGYHSGSDVKLPRSGHTPTCLIGNALKKAAGE